MNPIYGNLKDIILWNYERASWQWDLLCFLIILFIFLTPKAWFDHKRTACNPNVAFNRQSQGFFARPQVIWKNRVAKKSAIRTPRSSNLTNERTRTAKCFTKLRSVNSRKLIVRKWKVKEFLLATLNFCSLFIREQYFYEKFFTIRFDGDRFNFYSERVRRDRNESAGQRDSETDGRALQSSQIASGKRHARAAQFAARRGPIRSSGTISLLPGKGRNFSMRLDWTKPKSEIISVVNGQYVAYTPSINQAYTGNSDSKTCNDKGGNALKVMSMSQRRDQGKLRCRSISGRESISGGIPTWHLKLTPKASSNYKFVGSLGGRQRNAAAG